MENEVVADIKVANKEILGITVKSGDTLSKISKKYLDNPNRYNDIFNLNKDILTNPDLFRVKDFRFPTNSDSADRSRVLNRNAIQFFDYFTTLDQGENYHRSRGHQKQQLSGGGETDQPTGRHG
jgi:hypothetical protein